VFYVHVSNFIHIGLLWQPTGSRKNKSLLHFQLQHSVVAPTSGAETKLTAGAQLQTFPYSKVFPYSNALMAKSLEQTLLFKSTTYKKINTEIFRCPVGVKFQSYHGTMTEKGHAILALQKHFCNLHTVSPPWDTENLGGKAPPNFKSPSLWNPLSKSPNSNI